MLVFIYIFWAFYSAHHKVRLEENAFDYSSFKIIYTAFSLFKVYLRIKSVVEITME